MASRFPARIRWITLSICTLVVAGGSAVATRPEWVERYYTRTVAVPLGRILGTMTGIIPGSVFELLAAAALVIGAWSSWRGIQRVVRGERRWRSAVGAGALNLAVFGAVVVASFYTIWGFNYYRPPLAERLGWSVLAEADRDLDALESLAGKLVESCNRAYREVYRSDRAGTSRSPIGLREVDAAIEVGFTRIAEKLDVPAWRGSRGRAKPLRTSAVLSRFGLAGVYLPWTSEASFNARLPDVSRPQTIAHEKAHQRGIAPEDEAGFVGFLATLRSPEPYVRYSGLAFAQEQALAELGRYDPARAAALREARLDGVVDDLRGVREFWSRFRGPLTRVGTGFNDAYLRAHGVEDGVMAYSRSVELILQWWSRSSSADL